MLKELYIENIAIIKKLSINLSDGLTIFTGETGSGKSIIIDAINLIMGSRGSKNLIRSGERSCFVSAVFRDISSELLAKLKDMNYNLSEDDDLLISREFFYDSKNTCRINGKPCNVSILKELSSYLITVHGQHENHSLFDNEKQRYLLDQYGGYKDILNEYKKEFVNYQNLKREYDNFNIDEAEKQRKIDILKFQIDEIKTSNLKPNEEEELLKTKQYINNYKVITKNLLQSISLIDGDENTDGINISFSKLENCLSKCQEIENIENIISKIQEMRYNITEISYELNSMAHDDDFNENDINEIELRLDIIYKLKRKYGSSYDEIMSFYNKISKELENIILLDENREKLKIKLDNQYNILDKLAKKISYERKNISEKFVSEIKKCLIQLDLPNVNFYIDLKTVPFNEFGIDKIDFLITTNIGEPLKPLSKIASGGEISRVMLAINNVISDNDIVDTIIFDEIDIGVSGKVAFNIGIYIKKLSKKIQVISVTHSAQIASMADKHFLISKFTEDNQTFTKASELDYEQRQFELARILGGAKITDVTLKSAKELLDFKFSG